MKNVNWDWRHNNNDDGDILTTTIVQNKIVLTIVHM